MMLFLSINFMSSMGSSSKRLMCERSVSLSMIHIPSFPFYGRSNKFNLFVVPGCTKCEEAKSKLNEMGIPYQIYNVFEHRNLLQNVPSEKKRQGFPLLKNRNVYYTYAEMMNGEF
ncbi:glutaredoxin domain-containing protein [Planococcus alpniumensis]|uniref:glutaredoxin domain-containing protein n=1 Tax=Planococcus alpniumensis TaxID=2708345 RepID=UPI0032C46B01